MSSVESAASKELPRMGSREDRRLNLRIGLGLLLFVVALALFAYRPAALLGVNGDALASSLGNERVSDHALTSSLGNESAGSCVEVADSRWECEIVIDPSSGSQTLYVETRAWGCWDAYPNTERDRGGLSGCVTFSDML